MIVCHRVGAASRLSFPPASQLASILTFSPSRIHTPDTCRRQLSTTSQARSKIDVLGSLKGLGQAPAPPLALGLAGVIPFVAAPAYMINTGAFCPTLATYHLGYGAVILSFLGGVRWGMAVDGSKFPPSSAWYHYTWSVTPSLMAWAALCLPSISAGYLTLIGGLGSAAYLDLIENAYPTWFKGLRILLTTVAVVSLVTGLACQFILEEKRGTNRLSNLESK